MANAAPTDTLATAPDEAPLPPPFDMSGDLTAVPEYKVDVDWKDTVVNQFKLIRGPLRKLRAVGLILLRLLP